MRRKSENIRRFERKDDVEKSDSARRFRTNNLQRGPDGGCLETFETKAVHYAAQNVTICGSGTVAYYGKTAIYQRFNEIKEFRWFPM